MNPRWPIGTYQIRRGLGLMAANHCLHLVEVSAMAYQGVQFCTQWTQAFDDSQVPPIASMLKKAKQYSGALAKKVAIAIDNSLLHYRQIEVNPKLSTQDQLFQIEVELSQDNADSLSDMYWDYQCNLEREETQGTQKYLVTERAQVVMASKNQILDRQLWCQ